MFQRRALKGHKKSIICLDSQTDFNQNVLASGSEDCTSRIWDVRESRAVKCFHSCFDGNAIDSVSFNPTNEHCVFIGSGSNVFQFDLRKDGILDKVPEMIMLTKQLDEGEENDGEEDDDCINWISVHPEGHQLAAASDDGNVYIMDTSTGEIAQTLSKGHTSIVSCTAYRPGVSGELSSVGFDCKACVWDVSSGQPKCALDFSSSDLVSGGLQVVNPPFIHNAAYACDGRVLMCASGDGNLTALSAKSLDVLAAVSAHDGSMCTSLDVYMGGQGLALANAASATSGAEGTSAYTYQFKEEIVFTGGNDGIVQAFKVKETKKAKSKSKAKNPGAGAAEITSLWKLNHGAKINSVSALVPEGPSFLLAASDVSKDITIYSIKI